MIFHHSQISMFVFLADGLHVRQVPLVLAENIRYSGLREVNS
jgi:hypothetical protein